MSQRIGGFTIVKRPAVVVDTNIYADGDNIGGLLTLSNVGHTSGANTGILQDVTLVEADSSPQNAAIDVMFFDANPSASTFTNNIATVIHADDEDKIIGVAQLAAANYVASISALAIVEKNAWVKPFNLGNDKHLYAALICKGTPTYNAVGDLSIAIGMFVD